MGLEGFFIKDEGIRQGVIWSRVTKDQRYHLNLRLKSVFFVPSKADVYCIFVTIDS